MLKTRPTLVTRRIADGLRNPLYRTGYALVANTIGTTVVGVVYWIVAAHLYDRQVVGRCSALVSMLIVVSALAQLDLTNVFPRFLSQTGRAAGRLIGYGYAASSLAAVVISVGFVAILPRLSPQYHFIWTTPGLAVLFVAASVVWGIFALEDAALTGLRRAVVVPVENSAYGVLKLLVLIGVTSVLPVTGIFVAWLAPLVLIVPAINFLIFRRYLKARDSVASTGLRSREIVRFAAVDYIGVLFAQAYGYLLPILVLGFLGSAANGSFFVAWTIAGGLQLLATNFGMSLLVEGARAPHRLAELTRGVLIRCSAVTVPGAVVLALGAPLILKIYGSAYAANAASLLGLLGIGTVPTSVVIIAFALDRIERRVSRAAFSQMALAVLVVAGSLLLMRKHGIDGVGLAWLGSSTVIAAARVPTIVRVLTRPATVAVPGAGTVLVPVAQTGPLPVALVPAEMPARDTVPLNSPDDIDDAEDERAVEHAGSALDLLAGLVAAALLAVVYLDRYGLLRVLLTLGFAFFVPGRAIVSNWPWLARWSEAAMSVVFSLVVVTLLAMIALWAQWWHPLSLFEIEAWLSLAGLGLGWVLRRRRAGRALPDTAEEFGRGLT